MNDVLAPPSDSQRSWFATSPIVLHGKAILAAATSRRDSFWSSLDEGDGNTDSSFVLEEFIASGRVFMNSMLDSLMSECYRKPWITQFLHLLINGSINDLECVRYLSYYLFLCDSDYNFIPENCRERRLFQVEAPEELIALKYGECFRKFLDMVRMYFCWSRTMES